MISALVVIEAVCGLLIAVQSIRHMNFASRCTWVPVSIAWCVLGGAGVVLFWSALQGAVVGDWRIALLAVAVCAVASTDRRRPR